VLIVSTLTGNESRMTFAAFADWQREWIAGYPIISRQILYPLNWVWYCDMNGP